MKNKINYGLQYIDVARKDYVLGTDKTIPKIILAENGQWDSWLPQKEVQNFPVETYACTSFAILNAVEILLRREYENPENLSDRFLAYISGTKFKKGNNPQIVAETLRKKGDVVEKLWTFNSDMKTWEKIYSIPPQYLYNIALDFVNKYNFGHEWVSATPYIMKQALKYSPLTVAGWAWSVNSKGLYYSPEKSSPCHYFVVYGYVDNEYWKVFDSYDNSLKKLEWDFYFTMVKRYTLHAKDNSIGILYTLIKIVKMLKLNKVLSSKIIALINSFIQNMLKPITKKKDENNLVKFATAIRDFEGKKGDLNYRNNNPGNFRCSPVGYRKKYGVVKCVHGFAVFPTYAQGWEYLIRSIENIARINPEFTFLDFFERYAPTSDNNPTRQYANFVAKRCGVTIEEKVSKYIS